LRLRPTPSSPPMPWYPSPSSGVFPPMPRNPYCSGKRRPRPIAWTPPPLSMPEFPVALDPDCFGIGGRRSDLDPGRGRSGPHYGNTADNGHGSYQCDCQCQGYASHATSFRSVFKTPRCSMLHACLPGIPQYQCQSLDVGEISSVFAAPQARMRFIARHACRASGCSIRHRCRTYRCVRPYMV